MNKLITSVMALALVAFSGAYAVDQEPVDLVEQVLTQIDEQDEMFAADEQDECCGEEEQDEMFAADEQDECCGEEEQDEMFAAGDEEDQNSDEEDKLLA